jgi:hypothetical protein
MINMAQIFVSHSKEDRDLVNFFSRVFAITKVRAVLEEFEKILTCEITSAKVIQDIENSNAVFVILSKNVQGIPHTTNWVVWETGVAKNKDIWIFEPYSQFSKISVVIPYLRHYVIFDINNSCFRYIRRIVESYDDSHILPTVLLTSIAGIEIGTALTKDKVSGAVLGGIEGAVVGLAISDRPKERPIGLEVTCASCHSTYNVHIPKGMNIFRCPVCNSYLEKKI